MTAFAPAFFASSVILGSLPGANGVVELSPFEFLDRRADLVPPPPLAPARGPPADWGEIVQAHGDRDVFQPSPNELPVSLGIRRK